MTAADPKLLELISKNEAYWLLPDAELLNPPKPRASFRPRLQRLAENRSSLVIFFGLLAIANVALFVSNALRYQGQGPWLMLAHGAGGCINLDGALVLVPVLRRILHWARQTALGRLLPLDDALLIHRVLGVGLFVLGLLHSAAHFANYSRHAGILELAHWHAGRADRFRALARVGEFCGVFRCAGSARAGASSSSTTRTSPTSPGSSWP